MTIYVIDVIFVRGFLELYFSVDSLYRGLGTKSVPGQIGLCDCEVSH